MLRHRLQPPTDLFPINPWAIETVQFTGEYLQEGETVFALANGYLGIRGTHEEGRPVGEPGVYLNGFHELRPIVYGEDAYGFPRTGQTILSVPDGTLIKLHVDNEAFDLERGEVLSYHRRLDMGRGVLERELVWSSPTGKHVRLKTTRFVSLARRHLAGILYELTVENADADVVLVSELARRESTRQATLDPRLANGFTEPVLHPLGRRERGMRAILGYRTGKSGLTMACGMDHVVESDAEVTAAIDGHDDDNARLVIRTRCRKGRPFVLAKYLAYHWDDERTPEDLRAQAAWTLDHALEAGFERMVKRQEAACADFWQRSDVVIDGAPQTQQIIRWNLFQLLQATHCVDRAGVPARGLTGSTYEGHYFWDCEIYVLPFLIYTAPEIACGILKFRHQKLDRARARARELDHKGALFPWRTINGDEASAYYAAGTAQYHINADIAYAIKKYVEITGDEPFLHDYGAEILVETARLWADLGFYSPRCGGRFCITGVTGPDEYTAVVNNNYFTNLMARENMRYAAEVVARLERDHPDAYRALVRRTGLEPHEDDEWAHAASLMYLPYDETLGIHPQDDSFLEKELWDFENTPEEHYPLLLYYHPLNLYRHQVIKQADTILVMFLLPEAFTDAQKKRNFDYYDPLTTHDSSLSVCIQSIVANEIGYVDQAYDYFLFAATMDLSDVGGNMRHGAHIASIGGSWLTLVYGFGGLRDHDGRIGFRPRLPERWDRLRFPLTIRGSVIDISIDRQRTSYRLRSGERIAFEHEGETLVLTPEAPELTRPNAPLPAAQAAQ